MVKYKRHLIACRNHVSNCVSMKLGATYVMKYMHEKKLPCIRHIHRIQMIIQKLHEGRFMYKGGKYMSQNEKKRIKVDIYNQTYTIMGDEEEHHVRLVASLVDQKMREIKEMNRHLDAAKLAVLTAVNTVNEHVKLKEEYATLLGQLERKRKK